MKLYEEIIFLQMFCTKKWVIENVQSYYEPFIKPQEAGHHFFWANFNITDITTKARNHMKTIKILEKTKGFDISGYRLTKRKDQVLRNCVNPKVGLQVFNCAFKTKQLKLR